MECTKCKRRLTDDEKEIERNEDIKKRVWFLLEHDSTIIDKSIFFKMPYPEDIEKIMRSPLLVKYASSTNWRTDNKAYVEFRTAVSEATRNYLEKRFADEEKNIEERYQLYLNYEWLPQ